MRIKKVVSKTGKVYIYDANRYKYTHKSTRGLTLVGKSGKINKKNINTIKNIINANNNYSAAEKKYLIADLDAYVAMKHINQEKLTSTGFFGKQESDEIDRMFTNAGYSIDEAASLYGIPADELRNPNNWNGDEFTYNGKTYKFTFTYTGDILTEI